MLKNHNVAKLRNLAGKNKIKVEINFDKDHPEHVKILMRNEFAIVDRKELFGVAMLLANEEDLDKIIDTGQHKTTDTVQHIRAITVKAQKDIKKDEEVVFNIQYEVPKRIVEYLGGVKEVVE